MIYRAIIYDLSRDNFHLSRDIFILSRGKKSSGMCSMGHRSYHMVNIRLRHANQN